MPTYKIIELIDDVISGEWGQEVVENTKGVKVIRTTNFSNIGKLDLDKEVVYRDIDEEKVNKKKLQIGDIIIEKSGGSPEQPVGRVVFFEENDLYLCNNFTSVLRPKEELVVPKFLMYLLFNLHRTRKVLKFQNKTTGIINLKLEQYLKQTEVEIPSLKIQRRIVQTLDKAFELIEKRQSQITALDELTQSLFLEMFGDPVSNNLKWKVEQFGSLIEVLTDYHANGSYKVLKSNVELLDKADYALMIRTTDLENSNYTNGVKYITKEAYEFLKKTQIHGGEIIINKIGSAGNVYLMPYLNRPVSLGMNQFMIRVNEKTVNRFIHFILTSPSGEKLIKSKVQGAVTKSITKDAIREIPIILPPLELQNKFCNLIEELDNKKLKLIKALDEMNNLYNSLIQKAFKGELFQEQ